MELTAITKVDIAIILVITISSLMSIKRGFIREALSLIIWVAALAVAIIFHPQAAPFLEEYIALPSMRNIAAMVVLFVITLIIGSVVSFALSSLIKATGLTATDRLLGVLFGALRGALVVALMVMFAKGLFAEDPWWQASQLIPYFEALDSFLHELGSSLYNLFAEYVLQNKA